MKSILLRACTMVAAPRCCPSSATYDQGNEATNSIFFHPMINVKLPFCGTHHHLLSFLILISFFTSWDHLQLAFPLLFLSPHFLLVSRMEQPALLQATPGPAGLPLFLQRGIRTQVDNGAAGLRQPIGHALIRLLYKCHFRVITFSIKFWLCEKQEQILRKEETHSQ